VKLSQNLKENFYVIFNKCWGYSSKFAEIIISLCFDIEKGGYDAELYYFKFYILPLFRIITEHENDLEIENLLFNHITSNLDSYRFRFAIKVPESCTIMNNNKSKSRIEIKDFLHYDVLGDGYCSYRVLKYVQHINNNMLDQDVKQWFQYISNEELESIRGNNRFSKLHSIILSFHDDSDAIIKTKRMNCLKSNQNLNRKLYPYDTVFTNASKDEVGRLVVLTNELQKEIEGFIIDDKEELTEIKYDQHFQVQYTNDTEYFGIYHYSLNNMINIVNSRLFAINTNLHCTLFGYENLVATHLCNEINVAIKQWCRIFCKYYKCNQKEIEDLMNNIVPQAFYE
jgi:hypothetical protein